MDLKSGFKWLADWISPPMINVEHPNDMDDAFGIKAVAVREGYRINRFDFRGPRKDHAVGDIDGLIGYVKRHGDPFLTTVFCDGASFVAVLDDVNRPDLNTVTMKVRPSLERAAWNTIVGKNWGHVEFRDEIENRADDLVEMGFAANLAKFKHRATVEYDSDLDGGGYGFTVKEGQKAGTANVPRCFSIEIPVFGQWSQRYTVTLRLNVSVPRGTDKPTPVFSCAFRDIEDAEAAALDDMIRHIRKELGDNWLVVRGAPSSRSALFIGQGA